MNILDNVRDTKLMQLYQALTKSDLKGNYEDTYLVELLFTILTIDLAKKDHMSAKEMVNFAKEIVRIYETDTNEFSYLSVRNWTESLFDYMNETGKKYKDIHKMSTFQLRMDVRKYLRKDDE